MKTSIYFLCGKIVFLLICNIGFTQNVPDYLNELPKDLQLDKTILQTYHVTTDYLDYNLKGKFTKKMRVEGNYTCGLGSDSVKWNNVSISHSKQLEEPFPKGTNQDFTENFTYVPSEEILTASFYTNLPEFTIITKNLMWDLMGIEGFAYWHWNDLKLNTEYEVTEANFEVDLAGEGTFENKDIRLKWIGITSIDNEVCAIIKYSTMNNPLSIKLENFAMTGRSHYWGEVYVSLLDKQIEYASLSEDVVIDLTITGQKENQLGYTVRNIKLEKIK